MTHILKDLIGSSNKSDKIIDRINERWLNNKLENNINKCNSLLVLYQNHRKETVKPSIREPINVSPELSDKSLWKLVVRVLYPEVDLLTSVNSIQFHKEFNRFIADTCNKTKYFDEYPIQKSNFRIKDFEDALLSRQPKDAMVEVLGNLYNLDIVSISSGIERIYRPIRNRYLVAVYKGEKWHSSANIEIKYQFQKPTIPKLLDDYQQNAMKKGISIWKPGKGIRFILKTKEELNLEIDSDSSNQFKDNVV